MLKIENFMGASQGSDGYVNLLEVLENFWHISRTAERSVILGQNFDATSSRSLNHA